MWGKKILQQTINIYRGFFSFFLCIDRRKGENAKKKKKKKKIETRTSARLARAM